MYYKRDIHIGKLIKDVFSQSDLSVVDFAKLLNCQRQNIYDIFNRESIDIDHLIRISRILNHDFLAEYYMDEEKPQSMVQKIAMTITFDYDGIACKNIEVKSAHIIPNKKEQEE